MNNDENRELEDSLTDEQRAADAAAVAANMGPFFAPMLQAKRAKAAKYCNRKMKDRRFSVKVLNDAPPRSANSTSKQAIRWNQAQIDMEEFFRIIQIRRSYEVHVRGNFEMLPDANLDRMFDEIFQDRDRTPANLLRLYHFMCLKHPNGIPAMTGTPLHRLVVKILVRDGLLEEAAPEWAPGDPKTWIEYDNEGRIK